MIQELQNPIPRKRIKHYDYDTINKLNQKTDHDSTASGQNKDKQQ